jgi:O-antigen/teichoic acid export membrane protein
MHRLRPYRSDLLALLVLFFLPLLWFAPVLVPSLSGQTLLPYDNLYAFEPWRSLEPDLVPHNLLLSDLALENAVWKLHIRRTLAAGEAPLWNPQILTGQPFLAAGQSSALYPLSVLFYLLPLEAAYGWFTALQLGLAGVNMYLLARSLRLRPPSAFLAGVVYMFSGFLVTSVVFTMFIAAAAWLPLLLAAVEWIIHKQEDKGLAGYNPVPYIAVGVLACGLLVLAGHPELIYYTLLVTGLYAGARLLAAWRVLSRSVRTDPPMSSGTTIDTMGRVHTVSAPAMRIVRRLLILAFWLLAMALLGLALGGVQLLPLVELVPLNFRAGSVSYQDVVGWAWPTRHVLTFWLPDVFGNPSHHGWFDLWNGQWTPATVNALGEATHTIFWGIKNYVEGGNYLGIAVWLLAAVAALSTLKPYHEEHEGHKGEGRKREEGTVGATGRSSLAGVSRSRPFYIWFFAGLALASLLFAFGTPLYALLFYGLPGWDQLHSPFRWVFPFTMSMAILAAFGLQTLLDLRRSERRSGLRTLVKGLAALCALAGVAALGIVAASWVVPAPFLAIGERIVDGSDLARMAFADGRMFWGYQAANLVKFGLFALLAGVGVWWVQRPYHEAHEGREGEGREARKGSGHTGRRAFVHPGVIFLLAVVALDLYAAHGRFNPAADVSLSPLNPERRPPVVDFLEQREAALAAQHGGAPSLWRFTTFNLPGEKTFNANAGMYYGWHDLRGYDSIIPRQYVELMDRIAPQANELLYNRIAPLYSNAAGDPYAILDNPLLDLLNVKYILTEHYVPNPTWQEIYRDASIAVYENRDVLPRAWIVPEARVAPVAEQPLSTVDGRRTIYLDAAPTEEHALLPSGPQTAEANISRYTTNELFVDVNMSDRGWLLLSDAYFPGWKAYLRPFGSGEGQEAEIAIHRANGALRAVYLPAGGQWTVRFVYSPMSFKLGLYTSFVAVMALALLLVYWLWYRVYRPETTQDEVRTVAKNWLVPTLLSFSNKAGDFVFAMLYVRVLGPEDTGSYAFVVSIYIFFEILVRYGLGTLLTRDVAADKNQSSRYLTNVLALRTLLWLGSLPLLALVIGGYWLLGRIGFFDIAAISVPEVQALAIFALSLLFSNWADAFSSMFNAFEKMEYPAGLANAIDLLKLTLGALVLLLGWSFVGLALVSLIMNIVQVFWFYTLLRKTLFPPEWRWDWSLQLQMVRASGPLMLNHLLAFVFWRVDLWILRPLAGAASVGIYSVGLKYLDGLNIIPSLFTMAVFPLMSRYAQRDNHTLLRSYVLSLRLLIMASFPIAVAVTVLARLLVWLVGGSEYLDVVETATFLGRQWTYIGGSDLALQMIIWSIPIGFANSITQYALIAVHQQRYLTRAFLLGVLCNIVGNILVIPSFGYVGAAIVTILSEFALFFPFYACVRRTIGPVAWGSIYGPPVLSAALMGGAAYALIYAGLPELIAVLLSGLVYIAGLVLTGGLGGEEIAVLRRALPLGPLRRETPADA